MFKMIIKNDKKTEVESPRQIFEILNKLKKTSSKTGFEIAFLNEQDYIFNMEINKKFPDFKNKQTSNFIVIKNNYKCGIFPWNENMENIFLDYSQKNQECSFKITTNISDAILYLRNNIFVVFPFSETPKVLNPKTPNFLHELKLSKNDYFEITYNQEVSKSILSYEKLIAIKEEPFSGVYPFYGNIQNFILFKTGKTKTSYNLYPKDEMDNALNWLNPKKKDSSSIEESTPVIASDFLAIKNNPAAGIYPIYTDIFKTLKSIVKTTNGVSYRIFKSNELAAAKVWVTPPSIEKRIVAIKTEPWLGLYEFSENEIDFIKKLTGKINGISYKVFDLKNKDKAANWVKENSVEELDLILKNINQEPNTISDEVKLNHKYSSLFRKGYRKILFKYYKAGGNSNYLGVFTGQIKYCSAERILIHNMSIKDKKSEANNKYSGNFDHVWIIGPAAFKGLGLKIGNTVSFEAITYAYQRDDKSVDFSLKKIKNVSII